MTSTLGRVALRSNLLTVMLFLTRLLCNLHPGMVHFEEQLVDNMLFLYRLLHNVPHRVGSR